MGNPEITFLQMKKKIRIALTMGDPAGIGPEIIAKALSSKKNNFQNLFFNIYGSPEILKTAFAKFAGRQKAEPLNYKIIKTGNLKFADILPGKNNPICGKEAYDAVVAATKDCIAGKNDAVVTAPLSKYAVVSAGYNGFKGHTELIAKLCGIANFAMMQSAGNLRVAFVTTHISIKKVPDSLMPRKIINTALLLADAVKSDGIKNPRIAVAALNPHAGENGEMGNEELNLIAPAICEIRKLGINAEGPFPPDTLFIKKILKSFDGILCMYHDQGHIPFKMLAFDRGVNSTLGLPIIRTSVDHGTAFDIAWKGRANPGSLIEAIKKAACDVSYRRKKLG
jgi:4-hydroxythreonine-4-phosphate dehydrogenase